jgi:hypothetical protein
MRDDASLRRLAEIGIDVYVLRGAAPRDAAAEPVAQHAGAPGMHAADAAVPGIVVLADAPGPRPARVLADVERAFGLAGIHCTFSTQASEATLAGAAALVAFGEPHARAAGACMPAQRQDEIGWVVVAETAMFAGDAAAKRALWSELKRIMRPLRTDRTQRR